MSSRASRRPILALLAGVLALAAAEVVLRAARLAPQMGLLSVARFRLSANPDLGYEPVPNFAYPPDDSGLHEFRDRANRQGFRDRDHAERKPPGVFRILVLGDSVAMGLYVEDRAGTFPAVMERALLARGRNVEVFNFGVSGYNTQQEVAMLKERGLRVAPDLVLLQYCLNDHTSMDGGLLLSLRLREQEGRVLDRHRLVPLLRHSAVVRLLYARVLAPYVSLKRERAYRRLSEDTVAESLEALRVLADRRGFAVTVAVFPAAPGGRFAGTEDRTRIARLCAQHGFSHADLQAWLDLSHPDWPRALMHDTLHPNAAGHAVLGERLAELIAEDRRLPW